MIKEHYSILFCSLTGNTKKLADAIYETLSLIHISEPTRPS